MIYANCGAIAVNVITSTTYMTIVELFDECPALFSHEMMIIIDHDSTSYKSKNFLRKIERI